MKAKRIQIRIDEKMFSDLKFLARVSGRTISNSARFLINKGLQKKGETK